MHLWPSCCGRDAGVRGTDVLRDMYNVPTPTPDLHCQRLEHRFVLDCVDRYPPSTTSASCVSLCVDMCTLSGCLGRDQRSPWHAFSECALPWRKPWHDCLSENKRQVLHVLVWVHMSLSFLAVRYKISANGRVKIAIYITLWVAALVYDHHMDILFIVQSWLHDVWCDEYIL